MFIILNTGPGMHDDYLPVSQQIHILFDAIRHPDDRPYTLHEVSDAIDVSLATLSQLRSGKIRNPQLHTLREICRFFRVPLRYFETRSVEECYAIIAGDEASSQPTHHEIAFRATRLTTHSQRDVLTIIKWVQAAEQQRQDTDSPDLSLPGLHDFDDE